MSMLREWLDNLLYKLKLIKKIILGEPIMNKTKGASIDDIIKRNDKMRELEKKEVAAGKESETLICPTCGSEADELYSCVKCGRKICDSCGTYCSGHIETENGIPSAEQTPAGHYCEECW